MSNLNKKQEQTKAQDYVTNKLLCVFTIAFVLIIAVMNVGRLMRSTDTFVAVFNRIWPVTGLLAALTVIAAIIAIIAKVRKKDEKYKLVTAKHIAIILAFVTVCSALLAFALNQGTISFLYVFIPAVTVFFIIYNTFPKDYFTASLISGIGAIGIWLMGSAMNNGIGVSKFMLIVSALVAVSLIGIIFTVVLQVSGGKLFGKRVFNKESKYVFLYIACVLLLALLAAMFAFGAVATYYAIFALIAYIVLSGIYYAIKMM